VPRGHHDEREEAHRHECVRLHVRDVNAGLDDAGRQDGDAQRIDQRPLQGDGGDEVRESREAVAQVGFAVGYESEAAFSPAFKREFGQGPAQWRRGAVPGSRTG
jgi:AraC-like DNA-binding protein